jgi:hypothetical protein
VTLWGSLKVASDRLNVVENGKKCPARIQLADHHNQFGSRHLRTVCFAASSVAKEKYRKIALTFYRTIAILTCGHGIGEGQEASMLERLVKFHTQNDESDQCDDWLPWWKPVQGGDDAQDRGRVFR